MLFVPNFISLFRNPQVSKKVVDVIYDNLNVTDPDLKKPIEMAITNTLQNPETLSAIQTIKMSNYDPNILKNITGLSIKTSNDISKLLKKAPTEVVTQLNDIKSTTTLLNFNIIKYPAAVFFFVILLYVIKKVVINYKRKQKEKID